MDKITKKIYYHDTDWGGVVYYANYLKYFEEGRTEFFLSRGIDLLKTAREGFSFVVKSIDISYQRPARYGQLIDVKTSLIKVKNASLQFLQKIELNDVLLVVAQTKIACVNKSFKASLIPDYFLNKVKNDLSNTE